jgi:hypothetical protein
MAPLNPKAVDSGKGQHPDLVRGSGGELEFRSDADLPPPHRDFLREWADDDRRAALNARIAREFRQQPIEVQEALAGRDYSNSANDPYLGYREFLGDVELYRQSIGGVGKRVVTSADVARYTLEEYERDFDSSGRPREGIEYVQTNRDLNLSTRSGFTDQFSAGEAGWR